VAKVDDLGAGILHDTPHDVYGHIMTVEKRRSRDNAHMILGFIDSRFRHKSIPSRTFEQTRTT
jgi:hypothetical protein